MSKRAGESFVASASAEQKPVHCTAMIARTIGDKKSDMDYHAVPPPDYIAGGDSKRQELCQENPSTTHHNGDWSSIKLLAPGRRK